MLTKSWTGLWILVVLRRSWLDFGTVVGVFWRIFGRNVRISVGLGTNLPLKDLKPSSSKQLGEASFKQLYA